MVFLFAIDYLGCFLKRISINTPVIITIPPITNEGVSCSPKSPTAIMGAFEPIVAVLISVGLFGEQHRLRLPKIGKW